MSANIFLKSGFRERFGLGRRLLFAFIGISAFAFIAAGVSLFSFFTVDKAITRITRHQVPTALTSLKLSNQAERLLPYAPLLMASDTMLRRKNIFKDISQNAGRLTDILSELKTDYADHETVLTLARFVRQIIDNFEQLDLLVANRIVASERKKTLLRKLSVEHKRIGRYLSPGIRSLGQNLGNKSHFDIQQKSGQNKALRIVASAPSPLAQLANISVYDTLLDISNSAGVADIKLYLLPLKRQYSSLAKAVSLMDDDIKERLDPRIEAFGSFIDGPKGIPQARRDELKILARSERLVAENIRLSKDLSVSVEQLVAGAIGAIEVETMEARDVQERSRQVLYITVFLSLVCSILVIWLYVQRNLIARLTALSDAMLSIAKGDLKSDLPKGGGDEIGRMAKALTVFRDTAIEVKESNLLEIKEAQAIAEHASQAKSDFLANMSHELRTPLNAVIGFSEILKKQLFGSLGHEKYLQYASDIHGSGTYLLDLINSILDLSKVEADEMEIHEEEVDLKLVIEDAVSVVRHAASAAGIELEIDVPDESPGLYADQMRLKQILLNLLTNAIKFSPRNSQVVSHVGRDVTGRMIIRISDKGKGLAPDEIEIALKPFGQVADVMTRDQEGTGLGLPLCKSFMELHGGTLLLESELDHGTTVILTFPAERTLSAA
ncbi:MAG: HAMP domain-containing protein [Alphaproteobacteria bacterium]|jgi:signal transduction histidine kinase|nr:HAMP domain-containing protein [Alphaproteobacteria bacterium]MBT4017307.1 HAMP domain-containing protein [Alphaproteobacteria bacterium]MBT4965596.1 HAMP domain-containing protein [Alphaproteobacteria bacterium]MBT5161214.1 HAMP domain-containing protein [Alphaproteobacteria bacterium]MBT5919686.1 HAMP domain-containing protein [Alphaproteobacteria bacterium]